MEFAVLSSQRTGSTLLVRSLDAHPELFVAGELFHYGAGIHHPEYRFRYLKTGFGRADLFLNKSLSQGRIPAHLERFYSAAGQGVRAVGFKLMLSQIKWNPALLPALKARKVRFLILVRENAFSSALSAAKAQLSGTYHSDAAAIQGQTRTVSISEERFERLLNAARFDRDRLSALAGELSAPLMTYEHMSSDWQGFMNQLGQHLDIESLAVPAVLEKLDDQKRGLRLENEAELRQRFENTER
jgi:hypothetical protein